MSTSSGLKSFQKRWNQYGTKKHAPLLRLALLRELYFFIHAEKSRLLAISDLKNYKNLSALSERILAAQNAKSFEGSLDRILSGRMKFAQAKSPSLLPPKLSKKLLEKKLERADRLWERALILQAARDGWDFYLLEAKVKIESAQLWDKTLSKTLLPQGVVIFAESAKTGSAEKVKKTATTAPSLWHGQWLCVIQNGIDPQKFFTPPRAALDLKWSLIMRGDDVLKGEQIRF